MPWLMINILQNEKNWIPLFNNNERYQGLEARHHKSGNLVHFSSLTVKIWYLRHR